MAETNRLVPAWDTEFSYNRFCHLAITGFGTGEVRQTVVIDHGLTYVVMKDEVDAGRLHGTQHGFLAVVLSRYLQTLLIIEVSQQQHLDL